MPDTAERRPAIEARDVTVRRGLRPVLDRVSLRGEPGEILAVLGPNGAGKTTMLRALAGLDRYDGEIYVDGLELRALPIAERARRVAYVPQRSLLRSALAVDEVVAMGRFAHGGDPTSAVRSALQAVDAESFASRKFTALSVGEQQRVLLARALATEARCLLLDEPTSALDIGQSLATFALLRELADASRCIVVVLHGLDDARQFADSCLVIDQGSVVAGGPPREVIGEELVRDVYGVRLVEGGALGFEPIEAP